jgi:hypothetical protein
VTRTVKTSLGFSSLSGKSAIDQAARFKDQLRSLNPKPKSVSLLTVTHAEPPHMEVVAVFDKDDPVAVEWVKKAEVLAPELWEKLAARRKGVVR